MTYLCEINGRIGSYFGKCENGSKFFEIFLGRTGAALGSLFITLMRSGAVNCTSANIDKIAFYPALKAVNQSFSDRPNKTAYQNFPLYRLVKVVFRDSEGVNIEERVRGFVNHMF